MSGFAFEGVVMAPNGEYVPAFPVAESAVARIRERWSAFGFTDADGELMAGDSREAFLDKVALDDALWQFWLSNDMVNDLGERSWDGIPLEEKVQFLFYCVRDGYWWRNWATTHIGFSSWLWQKKLAFERTAVREAMNASLLTPASAEPDAGRLELVSEMVRWHEEYDADNPNLSPYDVPDSYIGLVFDTM